MAVLKGGLHEWTIREQLILASAVQRSGDQNWVSVSRAIKPLVESDGWSSDYFSQKNCAQQYSSMLDKAGTHKRKRSTEGSTEGAETAGQQIVRELTEKYIKQLNQSLLKTKQEYLAVKKKIELVENGELDDQLPAMLEEMHKETAAAKAAAKSKSIPASSNLTKTQEQVKQNKSLPPPTAQAKEVAVVAEPVSPSKGAPAKELLVKKKLIKVEADIATTESSKVSVSATFPTVTRDAFVSSGLELSSKLPLGVTIKREPTASPMDVESPLPHIASTIVASPKEEKFLLPMQTPVPSTPGQIPAGEVHVIVHQPNIAALLAEDRSTLGSAVATKPAAAIQNTPAQKPLPSLVLSPSAPVLPNLVQSTVMASSAAVSVLKQPMAASSTGAPLISIPLTATTISLSRTPPVSNLSSFTSSPSSLTTALTTALTPASGHPQIATPTASKLPVATALNKPSLPTSVVASNRPSMSTPTPLSASKPSLFMSTSKPSVLSSSTGVSLPAPVNRPPVSRPLVSPAGKPAIASQSRPTPTTKPTPHTRPASTSKLSLSASKSSLSASVSRHSVSSASSKPASAPPNTPSLAGVNVQPPVVPNVEAKQPQHLPLSVKSEEKHLLLPALISSHPVTSTAGVVKAPPASTGKPLKLVTNPSVVSAPASSAVIPLTAPTTGVRPVQPLATPTTGVRPVQLVNVPKHSNQLVKSSEAPSTSKPVHKPVDKKLGGISKPLPDVTTQPHATLDPGRGSMGKGGTQQEMAKLLSTAGATPPAAPPTVATATRHQDNMPTDPRLQPSPSKVLPLAVPVFMKPVPAMATHGGVPSSQQVVEKPQKEQGRPDTGQTKEGGTKETSAESAVSLTPQRTSPASQTPPHKADRSKLTTPLTTPLSSVERELVSPAVATPAVRAVQEEEEEDDLDEETPVRLSARMAKSALKKQWNTRSRKRKNPFDDGHSVESTDTEDDVISQTTSAVSSPAPSQSIDVDPENVQSHKQWRKAIIIVWRHAAQHKYANLFLHPVREEDAPGYKNVVLRPMDLSTIKKKIELGHIKSDIEFQRDMLLMFQNAFMYNNTEHEVYYMAQEMKSDVMENIQDYLATQAQLQLMAESTPKTLRSREGRLKEAHEEAMFSPAKKRRTRADD